VRGFRLGDLRTVALDRRTLARFVAPHVAFFSVVERLPMLGVRMDVFRGEMIFAEGWTWRTPASGAGVLLADAKA
jgi:hypothetical protein